MTDTPEIVSRGPLQIARAAWGRIRRAEPEDGKRSAVVPRRMQAAYEAGQNHPLIPRIADPAPNMTSAQQRFMQVLARHLHRNDPWIRNLIRVMGDVHIGVGPDPVSRFPERDALFRRAARQFDHSGVRGWGGWLREDVYRNKSIDGEVWLLRRSHLGRDLAASLLVPLTFQTLTSEFVPHGFTQMLNGVRYVNGVALQDGRPSSYAVYPEHPAEPTMNSNRLQDVSASELYHVYDPSTGSVRGEVLLASALLRAIKASTLEDSELRRKHIASLMSVAIHRPAEEYDAFDMPSEAEVSAMIDGIQLTPGGIFELPYGYEAKLIAPPDEGANFEKALRWQLMAVCASAGIPPHEVLGDWNALPERMARYVGQSMERRATIVQQDLEHQLLNHLHRDFVDHCMALGLWTPPAGMDPLDLYEVTWEWPILPMASFKQELLVMMQAEAAGIIDSDTISKSMFGTRRKDVSRRRAVAAAQDQALGLVYKDPRWAPGSAVAVRYLAKALEEENRELDLQEAADLDISILDDDR